MPRPNYRATTPPPAHAKKRVGFFAPAADRRLAAPPSLTSAHPLPPMSADPLVLRLKHLIITALKLEGVTPEELPDNEPLMGAGLNLDSIDALELVVQLEKEFGIKISNSEESRTALASIEKLAAFVRERADPARLPK